MKTENGRVYTVTQLTCEIKELLETGFSSLWLEGEISNFRAYPSGHLYFSLKDENSVVSCVIFKSDASRIGFDIRDGISVLARGRVSVYGKRGQYQMYVTVMEPRGKGALQAAFEELKEKLRGEGLFDESRKRALPVLPTRVGVVTSSAGAAIEDILNVAVRRFANVEIVIRPVKVQGDEARYEISTAIKEFNEYNGLIRQGKEKGNEVDVLIVGRGGGSIEDLWPFNEEMVARAIAGSEIPVISAVGHEVDYTIADFVADFRAPTPSAAAELVMPRKDELEEQISAFSERMSAQVRAAVESAEKEVTSLSSRYVLRDPANMLVQKEQELDDLWNNLIAGAERKVEQTTAGLSVLAAKMKALSPLGVLERGYSITFSGGAPVTDAGVLEIGAVIETRLAAGTVSSKVESLKKE